MSEFHIKSCRVHFMFTHIISHYEYPKWSCCLLVLHIGNYFHPSCGAVCLVTALTSVIVALNCFCKTYYFGI